MTQNRSLVLWGLVALVLIGAGAVSFVHLHGGGHGHNHGSKTYALKLNAGQKWQSDAPLRLGMERIRRLVEQVPEAASAVEVQAFVEGLNGQIDYLMENCKLAPEADETLHAILATFFDGAALLQGGDQVRAAAILKRALDTYADHFEHPGWRQMLKSSQPK